jgi:D-3-phosphoglycerate dehydrogenase
MVTAPYMQPVIDRFRGIFDENDIELLVPQVEERFEAKELIGMIKGVDGVICGDDRFTRDVLARSDRLKVISKWGTGIDSIDARACQEFGVELKNTPGAFNEPVADTVMGYMLCFARRLPFMDAQLKQGKWAKQMGRSLGECTLGIIGVGRVGKTVAKRAIGFGMKILGNDIKAMPSDFCESTGIEMVAKDELLSRSDFVSINCDLNPTSRHLISSREFESMKNTAVLINTARGPVVDERALVDALNKGDIGGAGLDVFEQEPLPQSSPLKKMDNVMLAPHNANSSPKAWEFVHKNTINNLLEVLNKKIMV